MADPTPPTAPATGPSAMPPLGTKPAPAKAPAKTDKSRRGFLTGLATWFGAAWATFSVSMGAMTLYTARFMFPNVLAEPPSTFKAGPPETYEPGVVVERFKQEYGTWIVRIENRIFALSTTCTHLGCTPNWLENEQKFKCPCHGSGFYKDGTNFEGPAPRPLERYKVGMSDDGQILVDRSKKFQKELGQWGDPDASITL
jgi:cytochrome b6-f complex iron-sulfur subunit